MRYFYYDTDTWYEIPVREHQGPEPELTIDGPTQLIVVFPCTHYEHLGDFNGAWVGTGDAKLLCVTPDSVDADDLNDDLDACTLLWYGRIKRSEPEESRVTFVCESIENRFLREPVPAANNVVDTTVVTAISATEITVADGGELLANRGLRVSRDPIIVPTSGRTNVHSGSDWSDYTAGSMGGTNGVEANIDTDDATSWQRYGLDPDNIVHSAAILSFDLSYPPPQFPIIFTFLGYISKIDTECTPNSIKVYNWVTSTYDTFVSSVTANPARLNFYLSSDYVRLSASPMVNVKIDGGLYYTAATDYYSNVQIQYACITYTDTNQHDPIEYKIQSVAGAVATLADGNPYEDFINIGDIVQILYKEDEWLQNEIIGLARKIDSLETPVSTKPTYSEMNYRTAKQIIDDIAARNKWYWYIERVLSSGKPVMVFAEKSSPTDNGLMITPVDIDGVYGVKPSFDAHNKYRQVVIKNKETTGKYPAAPAADDLPVIVLNRPEVPNQYLAEMAQAIQEQYTSVPTGLKTKIRTITISEVTGSNPDTGIEDFEHDTTGQAPADDSEFDWTVTPGGGTTCTVENQAGSKKLKIADGSGANGVDFKVKTLLSKGVVGAGAGADGDTLSWKFTPDSATQQAILIYGSAETPGSYAIQLFFDPSDNTVYYYAGSYYSTGLSFTDDVEATWEVWLYSTTQFKIRKNGGAWSAAFNNRANWDGTGARCDTFWNYPAAAAVTTYYYDDIKPSWRYTPGGDLYEYVSHPVQTAHPDKVHAGAELHVHAAATTKGGVDHQIDADFVIRELKWLHDGCAELVLGFDDASTMSPAEKMVEILSRHANDVTT